MGSRGRKSAASLSVIGGGAKATRRPDPPDDLNDEQAVVWREICADLPADWFTPKTYPLLVQYCRHAIAARRLHQAIEVIQSEEDFDFKAWADLLKLQQKESAILASLATKMRIAQQSTYNAQSGATASNKGRSGRKKPWDV